MRGAVERGVLRGKVGERVRVTEKKLDRERGREEVRDIEKKPDR